MIMLSSAERGHWIAAREALRYAILNERNARSRYNRERRARERPEGVRQSIGCGAGETVAVFELNKARSYLGLLAFEFHDPYRSGEVFHQEFVRVALQTGRSLHQAKMQLFVDEVCADNGQSAIAAA